MPSSLVRTYTEPYEYAAAIRATTIDMTVRERGHFIAKHTRIDFHRLWMQRLSENTSRTLHSSFVTGRAIVTFRTQPGQSLHWSGVDIQASTIIRHSEGEEAFQHSSGPVSWGAMSLPLADVVAVGAVMVGLDLTPPTSPLVLSPSPGALKRLQRLHATAGDLAEYAPAVLAHSEAARGLEQALIEAMIHCFDSEGHEDRAAERKHAAIMRRFHRVVEKHLEEPPYVPELCKEVGASLRTLNACCHEHLGMGPKHYLLLRRMHMVRRALRQSATAATAATTVTEVSTRYGFWQLGRLAVEYKALFGESPSDTLARVK
jgi:AraC-like DNA-binding protein